MPWYKQVIEAAHRIRLAALTALTFSGIPTIVITWMNLHHHRTHAPLWLIATDLAAALVMRAARRIEIWAIGYGIDVANTRSIHPWPNKTAQRYTRVYRRRHR